MVEGADREENDQRYPIDPRIPKVLLSLCQRTEQVQHVQTGWYEHLENYLVLLEMVWVITT